MPAGLAIIAFSADQPGETLAIPLQHNQAVDVVEHRFLVATGNVTYQWERSGVWFTTQDGDEQEWHYPLGQMMDRFTAQGGPGLLLLHGPGNTFIRDLAHGERILVQPSGLIWKDPTVRMHLHVEYPEGPVLVQLSQVAGQVAVADPARTWPGSRAVGVRAPGDRGIDRPEFSGHDPILVVGTPAA